MLKVREKAVKTHSGILRRVSSCSPDPYTWFFHCHLLSQSHGQTKTLLWPGDTFVLEDVETPGHLLPRRGLQPLVPVYRVLLLSLVQRSHSEARGGAASESRPSPTQEDNLVASSATSGLPASGCCCSQNRGAPCPPARPVSAS